MIDSLAIFRDAAGSFAENQKITAIRKVYQKGVMNPMINVDLLWKDYCAFENVSVFDGTYQPS